MEGALLVGQNGEAASLASGSPGEVLAVADNGRLVWMAIALPATAGALLGMVRSSDMREPNSVAVDADGYMTVNRLDVARLYVEPADEWVLFSGNALGE